MAAAFTFYRTTIGKKTVMAISGAIGYGFVIAHMIGNLHIFEGAEEFNGYAEFLREVGMPALPYAGVLWILRIVLLAAVVLHVTAAIQLTRQDRASRPVAYARKRRVQASFASMTLRWGGTAIFLFLIYHLMHFTFGVQAVLPEYKYGDPYHNVIAGFQNPIAVAVYVLAMAALGTHLYHGVWSMFQTLGLNSYRTSRAFRGLAAFSGIALFAGFSTVPFAVLFGIVR